MKKLIFSLVCLIFIINLAAAADWPICIDSKMPSSPEGLTVSGNLQLTWNEALDEPDCSGIAYYKIYEDEEVLSISASTSYSGSALADGIYIFGVSAVDKAENEGEKALVQVTFPISTDSGSSSSSSSSSSSGGGSSSSSSGGGGGGGGAKPKTNTSNQNNTVNLNLENLGTDNNGASFNNEEIKEEENQEGSSGITGAIVGLGKRIINSTIAIIGVVFIVGILILALIFSATKRKRR